MTTTRAATLADIPAIAALHGRWETAWLGRVECDEDEVRETLQPCLTSDEHTRLVLDGESVIGAAWWHGRESTLVIDPEVDAVPVRTELLDWSAGTGIDHLDVIGGDRELQAALAARGWQHDHSAFDLARPVTEEWQLEPPRWPEGVELRDLTDADHPAMHRLIYADAGWAEIPGHHPREFHEWHALFVPDFATPDQQVLAWRGERLVGVSTGRIFSDGSGWIAQLAVARDERGRGLGRALLLEALRRRRDAGATTLGLSVQATNRAALDLYLSVGLAVTQEWLNFRPPR